MKTLITLLCTVGTYLAIFMYLKALRAERGELAETSVVETAPARLFGGVPNALLGSVYYPLFAIAVWLAGTQAEMIALLGVCAIVGLVSLYLAYCLLSVVKMSCPYCWSAHAINWVIVIAYGAELMRRHAI